MLELRQADTGGEKGVEDDGKGEGIIRESSVERLETPADSVTKADK